MKLDIQTSISGMNIDALEFKTGDQTWVELTFPASARDKLFGKLVEGDTELAKLQNLRKILQKAADLVSDELFKKLGV